jgi:hypothetical protein
MLCLCLGLSAPRAFALQDAVDIQGDWNAEKARTLATQRLVARSREPKNPFCEGKRCNLEHKVLGEYEIPYSDHQAMVVVTASNDPHNDCHACAPYLSVFEFVHRPNGWALTAADFAITVWGQFGEADASGIRVLLIRNNLYGLFLNGGGTNQGETDTTTKIEARIGRHFKQILDLQTGEDVSGGSEHWNSQLQVVPRPSGFYELVVKRSGVRDGKKFSETERFRFDGSDYVSNGPSR